VVDKCVFQKIKDKCFENYNNCESNMLSEKIISNECQTVPARKKSTLNDMIGLVKAEGDAVESKKQAQKGLK
jgi:hypothetical protein